MKFLNMKRSFVFPGIDWLSTKKKVALRKTAEGGDIFVTQSPYNDRKKQ